MNPWEIVGIALALAMDAFAVSMASGLAARQFHLRHALTMGLWFGGFQALMPLLGWAGGVRLVRLIGGLDHWIAFVLLALVGGKMILEAFELEEVEERPAIPGARMMLVLAIATSIDALAVGLSFAVVQLAILVPIIVIGAVTFVTSAAGVWIGCRGMRFFEKKIEIIGGLILIGIGVKILVSHLMAA